MRFRHAEKLETEKKQGSRPRVRRAMGAIGCALTVGATSIVATGCENVSGVLSLASDDDKHTALYTPSYACDPLVEEYNERMELMDKYADDCIDDRTAKVALIAYDMPLTQAEYTSELAEDRIEDAYDGILKPDLVPILASPEASNQFHSWVEFNHGCVAPVVTQFGSYIARNTMDLGEYSRVIAISNQRSCNTGPVGNRQIRIESGHTPTGDRGISEIYTAHPEIKNQYEISAEVFDANTIAHEYGHMQSHFRHAGKVNGETDAFLARDRTVDLNLLNPLGNYDEYGHRFNIMGHNIVSKTQNVYLGSAQRHVMEWPERVTGEIEDTRKVIGELPIEIARPTSQRHDYAVLELFGRGFVIDEHEPASDIELDSLVFDPICDDDGPTSFLELSLVSSHRQYSISLGRLDLDTVNAPRKFIISNRTVELTATNNGFLIKEIT